VLVACVGFNISELERKIAGVEQRFLETTTIGVKDPKSDVIDLLSQLRHRTDSIVHRIVTRPNLRSLFTDRFSVEGNAIGRVRPFVFTVVFELSDL